MQLKIIYLTLASMEIVLVWFNL